MVVLEVHGRSLVMAKKTYNYIEHGLVAPVGMPTWGPSTIATVDGNGRRIVFVKMWTGQTTSYLFIDAETGDLDQIYPEGKGWGAFQVFWTPDNVIYDTMDNHLVAIDVPKKEVRKLGPFDHRMAMGYVQAADGTVFAGLYPNANLLSYSPVTNTYTDHGPLNEEVWPQYPRPLSIDDSGWLYSGISIQEMQIIAFDTETGEKRALIPAEQRQRGNVEGHLGVDGKIYVRAGDWGWNVLSKGEAIPVDGEPADAVTEKTDTFPDGSRYASVNVMDKRMFILDKGADEPREVCFDYESAGVNIYTIISRSDEKVYGATGIPLRIWSLDPGTGELENRGLGQNRGHVNQFVRLGDRLFGAIYSSGDVVEYNPREPYDGAVEKESKNPRIVHQAEAARDQYGRPHAVLAHIDGRHVLVGGNAARVVMGSGLLIYDTKNEEGSILDRDKLVPNQGINALVSLSGGDVLIGTSTQAPTGGVAKEDKTAVVARLNFETRTVTDKWPLLPETRAVRDMVVLSDTRVFGLAEPNRFFILDAESGAFVHDEEWAGHGDVSGWQAPRCITIGPDGNVYALFTEAVLCIDSGTLERKEIARPDAKITSGIAIVGSRLYFGSGPRLYSCSLDF